MTTKAAFRSWITPWFVPLFRCRGSARPLEVNEGALGQLNVIYDDPETGDFLQGTLYGATGPLRSDVLFQFPLSISANLTWARYLSPAMTLIMLFYPGRRDPANYIRLTQAGALEINYEWKSHRRPERRLSPRSAA